MKKYHKNILVTGGAGYIGSCLVTFLKKKFNVYVVDNLSIGKKSQIKSKFFYKINLSYKTKLEKLLKQEKFDAIIHLAAHSNLRKSIKNPKLFYKNNVIGTKNLINLMIKYKIKKIIFSSTASVYGEPKKIPIYENSKCFPISVYGKTKLLAENYIKKKSKNNFKYIIFRYFNVAGSIYKSNLGETKNPPEHLIPIVFKKVLKNKRFNVFNNFGTKDGTGIRDYIHVIDICNAHLKALKYLNNNQSDIFNLGSRKGLSTLSIVKKIQKLIKKKIYINFKSKKKGEPDILISDVKKARKKLKWKTTLSFDEILKDAFEWEKKFIKKKDI